MKKLLKYSKIQTTLGIVVIALAAGLFHCPSIQAARGGGSGGGGGGGIGVGEVVGGLIINLVANYIYDAAGNKISVTPPMNGQIIAKPKLEAYGGFRNWSTINGYAYSGLRPDKHRERNRGYNDDKWTEYFDVDYGEVVDNPDYDPDAEPGEPNSNKYYLKNEAGINDHGDEYKSTGQMEREYSTAKLGYVYDEDGDKYTEYTKKGRWVYYGTSERIKCYHRLVDEITDTDTRLAKNQKYKVRLEYRLAHLTWSKEKEDFEVKSIPPGWQFKHFRFSATSPDWQKVDILEKNTEIYRLNIGGSSQLYWKPRAVKPWLAKNYILWEREQHTTR